MIAALPTGPDMPAPRASVSELLAWSRDLMEQSEVDSPWLTALLLLEHATGVGREAVLAHPELVPPPGGVAAFRSLVRRRCLHEPTAYLLGYREFYGRRFAVTPATLIPRPETEGIIGLALERLDQLTRDSPPRLLDVGTGSGVIAVTLLTQRPHLTGVAVDSSTAALEVALTNATTHEVAKRLSLVACNLVDAILAPFPVVVANLPYVPTQTIDGLQPEVARYEPRHALDGGPDGMRLIGALLESAEATLSPNGSLLMEIGEGQAQRAVEIARGRFPDSRIGVEDDATGVPRFLVVDREPRTGGAGRCRP